MGLLSTYHKLKEHLKIYKYKFGEEISHQRIFWELIRNRWRSLFTLFTLVTICFLLDILFSRSLVPFVARQPWYDSLSNYIQFPSTQIIINLLNAIIQGVATVIGLLLSISLVVLELAANRYPHRMVRFLIEEKVGTYIVDILVTTLLFSLWTLFLLQRGTIIPYVSILVCVLLTSLSIVFLFVYRKHSLYFFQPRQGFLMVSNDARKKIYVIFERGTKLGRSVTAYLRNIVQERIILMQDFLNVLLDKKNPDPETAYGLVALSSILSLYIEGKRFISAQSEWFPQRGVPVYEKDYAFGLTQIHEELALGARTKQEPDIDWLDRQVLNVIDDVQRKAIGKGERKCLYALVITYKELIEKCFEHQEFSILDRVIKRVSDLGIEIVVKDYPEITNEFYNLIMLIVERSIRGSDLQFMHNVLTKISWLSDNEVLLLKLPKMFHEEILSYRKKLETELVIEGRILTPSDWIEKDVIKKISELDTSFCRKYYEESLKILSNLHKKVSSERRRPEIRSVLVAQLMAIRRALVLGRNSFASENIDGVLKQVLKSYKDLEGERKMCLDIFKEIELGCLNSIKEHEEKSLRKFFGALGYVYVQETGRKKGAFLMDIAEALLVVMSFAFLDSEFYTGNKSYEMVEDIVSKIFDVDKLIKLFETMTRRYDPSLTLRYHNWFKNIISERSKLPRIERKRKGFRSPDLVYDHPSEFIQRAYHIGIGECAGAMIRKLAERAKQSPKTRKSRSKKRSTKRGKMGGKKKSKTN